VAAGGATVSILGAVEPADEALAAAGGKLFARLPALLELRFDGYRNAITCCL
jgi:hypothetical protein